MIPEKWNKQSYIEFVNYLKSIKDEKYKKFHSSLVLNSKYAMIGIKIPILKDIAKKIAKQTDIKEYLEYAESKYFEEIMIEGFVISHIKNEEEFYKYFKKHIKKIDNWSLCDTFCNSIKIIRKYDKKYFKEAVELSLNKDEFMSRTGLVMILNHFIKEENIEFILGLLNKIDSDKFYVNMAEAWLVCELFIKYRDETLLFLKKNNLNKFTQNKAISKIKDSYRVSLEDKAMLQYLKR